MHLKHIPYVPKTVSQHRHQRAEPSAMVCQRLKCTVHRRSDPLTRRRQLIALICMFPTMGILRHSNTRAVMKCCSTQMLRSQYWYTCGTPDQRHGYCLHDPSASILSVNQCCVQCFFAWRRVRNQHGGIVKKKRKQRKKLQEALKAGSSGRQLNCLQPKKQFCPIHMCSKGDRALKSHGYCPPMGRVYCKRKQTTERP